MIINKKMKKRNNKNNLQERKKIRVMWTLLVILALFLIFLAAYFIFKAVDNKIASENQINKTNDGLTGNVALEINSWPYRLDLPNILVRKAVEKGIKMIIDTDSHRVSQMDLIKYGVAVARRGWAKKGDILNTLEYNEFIKWLNG